MKQVSFGLKLDINIVELLREEAIKNERSTIAQLRVIVRDYYKDKIKLLQKESVNVNKKTLNNNSEEDLENKFII